MSLVQSWITNTKRAVFELESISSESTDMEIENPDKNVKVYDIEDEVDGVDEVYEPEYKTEYKTEYELKYEPEYKTEIEDEIETEIEIQDEIENKVEDKIEIINTQFGENIICKLRQIWIDMENNNISKFDKMIIENMCGELIKCVNKK